MAKKKNETEEAAVEEAPGEARVDGEIDGTQTPSAISDPSQMEKSDKEK